MHVTESTTVLKIELANKSVMGLIQAILRADAIINSILLYIVRHHTLLSQHERNEEMANDTAISKTNC